MADGGGRGKSQMSINCTKPMAIGSFAPDPTFEALLSMLSIDGK